MNCRDGAKAPSRHGTKLGKENMEIFGDVGLFGLIEGLILIIIALIVMFLTVTLVMGFTATVVRFVLWIRKRCLKQ